MNKPDNAVPFYVTTAIPYVNAPPHIGFAMELIQADVLARYQRLRGRDVRFLTGTDENSLKNVRAAEAEGIATVELVERNAASFRALAPALDLTLDDFVRTSAQPRHRAGVEKLWRACEQRGDIAKRPYTGLYCVGCEQFYREADLDHGRCPEHGTEPERVQEDNYFFRLSRYEGQLLTLLESGALQVVPDRYRSEVLAFVRAGLEDFSISRSSERARGWGIPVPGDPEQVMYVWFDALGNYITALGYATDDALLHRYWAGAGSRVHVIGKGITRFHAVYWPAILLSAGVPLPSAIAVHGYLTVDGVKIGKSLGNAIDPAAVASRYGTDVVRYFLCRHVRAGNDGDFSSERLLAVRDTELADQWGNLLHRTVAMLVRYHGSVVPEASGTVPLESLAQQVRDRYESAFERLCHDAALDAAWSLVVAANKFVVEQAPWQLAKRRGDPGVEAELATTLHALAEVLRLVGHYLAPFTPRAAADTRRQLGLEADPEPAWEFATRWGGTVPGTRVEPGPPLFPKHDHAP